MFRTFNPWLETPVNDFNVVTSAVVVISGKLLEFKIGTNLPGRATGKPRGTIVKFSESSRLRMLKFIATVEWGKIPNAVFITLTYPDERAIRTHWDRNKDRALFWRYMEKHLGRHVSGLWRIEWKERKSGKNRGKVLPHIHLLVFGVKYVPKEKVREWWRRILSVEGPLATHVRGYDQGEHAAIYVAKYVGKKDGSPTLDYHSYLNSTGRHWGYLRRGLIPLAERVVLHHLTEREIAFLNRAAAEKLPWIKPGTPTSFSLLGDYAVDVQKNLFRIGIDRLGKKG